MHFITSSMVIGAEYWLKYLQECMFLKQQQLWSMQLKQDGRQSTKVKSPAVVFGLKRKKTLQTVAPQLTRTLCSNPMWRRCLGWTIGLWTHRRSSRHRRLAAVALWSHRPQRGSSMWTVWVNNGGWERRRESLSCIPSPSPPSPLLSPCDCYQTGLYRRLLKSSPSLMRAEEETHKRHHSGGKTKQWCCFKYGPRVSDSYIYIYITIIITVLPQTHFNTQALAHSKRCGKKKKCNTLSICGKMHFPSYHIEYLSSQEWQHARLMQTSRRGALVFTARSCITHTN